MTEETRKKALKEKEAKQVTRRQFLQEASIIATGGVVSALTFISACSTSSNTTSASKTTTPGTSTTTTSATNPITTTTKTTTTTNPNTSTTTNLPPAEGFIYDTPLEQPPKMAIPGCTTFTATDRKYVLEHMWVKMVAENIVAIGLTEKLVALTDLIYRISVPKVGREITRGGLFGYCEAGKMDVEFPSPVSGTVLQENNEIYVDLEQMINGDPYVKGWLVTVQLSHPEEWDELLTPQEYTDLNAKE